MFQSRTTSQANGVETEYELVRHEDDGSSTVEFQFEGHEPQQFKVPAGKLDRLASMIRTLQNAEKRRNNGYRTEEPDHEDDDSAGNEEFAEDDDDDLFD